MQVKVYEPEGLSELWLEVAYSNHDVVTTVPRALAAARAEGYDVPEHVKVVSYAFDMGDEDTLMSETWALVRA